MSVVAQLPPEMGGASGKACPHHIQVSGRGIDMDQVAYIDTEGTFRPDRIRSIADRFGGPSKCISVVLLALMCD